MNEDLDEMPPLHRFDHTAMATKFEIWISGEEAESARRAAAAAFQEIDRLEQQLSRFIETSDIAAINRMSGRGMAPIGIPALECLRAARCISAETGGAFDVTIGALMDLWKPGAKRRSSPPTEEELAEAATRTGMHLLELDEEHFTAGLRVAGAEIDLGAIGKGYAVDVAAGLLREWGIKAAVVTGGGSTTYALGAPDGREGWPLGVGFGIDQQDAPERRVVVRDLALSASGTEIQGEHILDPRTGRPPLDRCLRAWSLNPSATVSDALSTAFMVMSGEEVETVCQRFGDVAALLLVEREGRRVLERHGAWPV